MACVLAPFSIPNCRTLLGHPRYGLLATHSSCDSSADTRISPALTWLLVCLFFSRRNVENCVHRLSCQPARSWLAQLSAAAGAKSGSPLSSSYLLTWLTSGLCLVSHPSYSSDCASRRWPYATDTSSPSPLPWYEYSFLLSVGNPNPSLATASVKDNPSSLPTGTAQSRSGSDGCECCSPPLPIPV